jgi:hypothetical protein
MCCFHLCDEVDAPAQSFANIDDNPYTLCWYGVKIAIMA